MTTKPKLTRRSYASDVVLSLFGLVSVTGNLVPVPKKGTSKKKEFKQVCPECPEPNPIKRLHSCNVQHGPFSQDQIMKATEVDGKLHFVDLNEVEEVRESLLEPKHMNVWAHEMANLYPSGTGYRFFPTKATKLFPLFLHLAKNFILVGSLNISKSEKLYRLDAYGTDIILQPVFFPADVSEPLGVEIEVEEATFDMALQLAHKNLSEFNPNSYLNTTDEKFVQLVESLALGTERPNHSIPKDRDSEDGLASLARALDL